MSHKAGLAAALQRHTPARVGLQRAGSAIGTSDQLQFQLDHALARDAVHARLNVAQLTDGIVALGLRGVELRSAVDEGPGERQTYLRRPDLGRRLSAPSAGALLALATQPDVVFVIADGLSALAVDRHALPLLEAALPRMTGSIGPVCVVSQGRVAIGDEIGSLLGARVAIVLIGERPGLSAADSLGVYLTWDPRVGRTDAERNCISNVRAGGLGYAEAADRIAQYVESARRLGASGVALNTAGLLGAGE
jgi:ethanolamine ammonia-lyase small subunit